MAKHTIIGDIHGKLDEYQNVISMSDHPTVQIGDFGAGFSASADAMAKLIHSENSNSRFIRGNHDHLASCRNIPGFIEDGHIEGNTMFIGGAFSVDHMFRKTGLDWWPDEEVSEIQFNELLETYASTKPSTMITRDGPTSITHKAFLNDRPEKIIDTTTGTMFDRFLNYHMPDLWIFGHWHHSRKLELGPTTFCCLAELETMEIDI